MKVQRFMATIMASLALLAITACGPKPEPEPPPPAEPTAEELAQLEEQKLMPYREVAQKFNDGVWDLNPALFIEAVTAESRELFVKRTQLEMELSGEEGQADDLAFLKKQNDYKIVYYIKGIDVETGVAVVEGQSAGEVQFETQLLFVEEDGVLKIDHSEVLKTAVAELEASIELKKTLEATAQKIATVIADHNTALADANAQMFEATITAKTAELAVVYLQALPKKQGGKKKGTMEDWVKLKASKTEKYEIKEIDAASMTATVVVHPVIPKKLKKGEEAPVPHEHAFTFVVENGAVLFDCAEKLEGKIKALEEGK